MTKLRLLLLGSPQVERDGAPVAFDTRKATALLAYLAITGQAHTREALAALLWPEYDQQRAYANLRRTLWTLNQGLGREWLDAEQDAIALKQDAGLWLDVAAFHEHLATCRSHDHAPSDVCAACIPTLSAAVDLYRGDFMAGFTLRDSPAFDEWQFFQAETLRSELAGALQRLVQCHAFRVDWEKAIRYGRRWLALDPLHEPAHQELIRLYAWSGQRAAALRQYQECVRILAEELDTAPQEQTTQLYEAIRSNQPILPSAEVAAPTQPTVGSQRPTAQRHNLPSQPTPFVRRDEELHQIASLLHNPDCRLLTLVGPGGAGKTRLAIEAAREQLETFPDGVWFVPLVAVRSSEFILPALADALTFSFFQQESEEPKQQLLNYLREKQMLLVLDNFDRLVEGAGLLASTLTSAPQVKLLVTSRQRLNLREEWALEVRGMRYPEDEQVGPLEAYDAIQLFLQQARRADAEFVAGEAEIPAVIRICRLVEGMPLAIELAAAWVKLLHCEEIAQEIERSLDFLSTTMRDMPERHRSLRAVFDHSWQLLSDEEKRALGGLSAFHGGFDREAAEQVAGADLAVLSALVDKSLLHRGTSGQYGMHELLRQYAEEKLHQDPKQKADTRHRHGAYFVSFLEQRGADLHGERQKQALDEIGAEIGNIRAAWHWATEEKKVQEIHCASQSLYLYYHMRNMPDEGEEAFARAVAALSELERTPEVAVPLGMALAFQGSCASNLYRMDEAVALLRRSLDILRPLGEQKDLALATALAVFVGAFEDPDEAEQLARESVAMLQAFDHRWGLSFSLRMLAACVSMQGDTAQAKSLLQQSLHVSREIGDRWGMASTLDELGELAQHHEGARQEAKRFYMESLAIHREIGDRWGEQLMLDYIGYIERELGEYDRARQLHQESLAVSRDIGDPLGIAGSLDNLGLIARDLGDYDEAEHYFEQGLAIRTRVNHLWSIAVSCDHLADVAFARADYERAKQLWQQSADIHKGLARWGIVSASRGLGEVCMALGQTDEARGHLWAALVDTMQARHVSVVLDILVSAARLAAATGDRNRAAAWLAFVSSHLASSVQTSQRAQELLCGLEAELGTEEIAQAREWAASQTLEDVAKEALTTMQPV